MLYIKSRKGGNYYYDYITNNIYKAEHIIDESELKKGINGKISFTAFTKDEFKEKHTNILVINITNNCNMRCRYCAYSGNYIYERVHKNSNIRYTTAIKAIDIYFNRSENGKRKISFYGGEPTTTIKLLRKITNYIKNKDADTQLYMNTNLLKIDNDIISFLIDNNFILYVSIDGDKKIHDKNRIDILGKGTYDRLLNNLNNIYHKNKYYYKKNIAFIATLTRPYSIHKIKNLYESNDIYKQPWTISSVMPFNTKLETEINLFNDEIYKKEIYSLADEYINDKINNSENIHFGYWFFGNGLSRIHYRNMDAKNENHINNCCLPGVSKIFVDIHGNFWACERCENLMPLGNIVDGLKNEEAMPFVNAYREDCQVRCSSCDNVRFCDLCYISAKCGSEFNFKQRDTICNSKIKHLELLLYIYISILEENIHGLDDLIVINGN